MKLSKRIRSFSASKSNVDPAVGRKVSHGRGKTVTVIGADVSEKKTVTDATTPTHEPPSEERNQEEAFLGTEEVERCPPPQEGVTEENGSNEATKSVAEDENLVWDTLTGFPASLVSQMVATTEEQITAATETVSAAKTAAAERVTAATTAATESVSAVTTAATETVSATFMPASETPLDKQSQEDEASPESEMSNSPPPVAAHRGIKVHPTYRDAPPPMVEADPDEVDERSKISLFWENVTAFPKAFFTDTRSKKSPKESFAAYTAHTMINDAGDATAFLNDAITSGAKFLLTSVDNVCDCSAYAGSSAASSVYDEPPTYLHISKHGRSPTSFGTGRSSKRSSALRCRSSSRRRNGPPPTSSAKSAGEKFLGLRTKQRLTNSKQTSPETYEMDDEAFVTPTTWTEDSEEDDGVAEPKPTIAVIFSKASEMENDPVLTPVEAALIDDVQGAATFLTQGVASGAEIYGTVYDSPAGHDEQEMPDSPVETDSISEISGSS